MTFTPDEFDPINFQDTLTVTIDAVANQGGFGNNRFEVIIDENDLIDEINEFNNTASSIISSVRALGQPFPTQFCIESGTQVRFVSQSSDLLSERRGFLFELDTTRGFNSPLATTRTGDFKVLAEWSVDLPHTPNDTVVYYWRTKFTEILPGEQDIFAQSSFSYIPGSPEWLGPVQLQPDRPAGV